MSPTLPLAQAFGIGAIAGLRSMTAPALLAWAARWRWLQLGHSILSFLGSTAATLVLSVGGLFLVSR